MINLGETKDDTIAILEDLKQNLWIDIFTRAVMIDFTVYNGNINLFDYIRSTYSITLYSIFKLGLIE